STLAECPASYRRDSPDGFRASDIMIAPIALDSVGDESVAFVRSSTTFSGTTSTYVAFIRRAESVATVVLSIAGSPPSPREAIDPYARLADSKLQATTSPTTFPTPPSSAATIPAAPLPASLDAILEAAETHDIDALMRHIGTWKHPCVSAAEREQLDA